MWVIILAINIVSSLASVCKPYNVSKHYHTHKDVVHSNGKHVLNLKIPDAHDAKFIYNITVLNAHNSLFFIVTNYNELQCIESCSGQTTSDLLHIYSGSTSIIIYTIESIYYTYQCMN